MARPFLEFLHSQDLDWKGSAALAGADEKVLSEDTNAGERSILLRAKAGWSSGWESRLGTELFVLAGAIEIDGAAFSLHHYAYLPPGAAVSLRSSVGAILLLLLDAGAEGFPDPPVRIDTIAMPWDRSGLETEIGHLNYARKNLRLAPDGSRRTYLLGGMPQGHPARGARMERHPHAEEMFLIAGDMPCSLGVMTAGAYFHRPAAIWHGLDCTLSGFLLLMRTPGSNVTISEWSDEAIPVTFDPPYKPLLPPGHPSLSADARSPMPVY